MGITLKFKNILQTSLPSHGMDMKFSIDRNTYLSAAASAASASSLYDSAAKGMASSSGAAAAAAYGAYLDPSVLTKAYFDSKIYKDRNYAFDISKIYSSAAHQSPHHQQSSQFQTNYHHHQGHQGHYQQQQTSLFLSNLGRSSSANNSIEDRESSQTPQLSDDNDIKPQVMVGTTDSIEPLNSVTYGTYHYSGGGGGGGGNASATSAASDSTNDNDTGTDYRRPLTVIF